MLPGTARTAVIIPVMVILPLVAQGLRFAICASVHGIPMQPCFNVTKTSEHSFRGAISGLGFAYCDFVRRNPRLRIANDSPRVLPSAMAAAAQ